MAVERELGGLEMGGAFAWTTQSATRYSVYLF